MRKLFLLLYTRLFEFCAVIIGMATTIIWMYVKKSKAGPILLRRTKRFGRGDSDKINKRTPQEKPGESQCIDAFRLDSMDYLCCPACTGDLQLTAEKQIETKILEGDLECLRCKRRFRIKDSLANLTFPEILEGQPFPPSSGMTNVLNTTVVCRPSVLAYGCPLFGKRGLRKSLLID
jgi:uncharacterized protein YbaR (Trm112 family)